MRAESSGDSAGSEIALAAGPLFDDDAEVVELLDGGFDVAADLGAVLGGGGGRFSDGDDAAIAPGFGGQGGDGLGEVGEADLHLLAAGGLGAEQGALAHGTGVGVCEQDAEIDFVGLDGEEGIFPAGGVVDVDVEALGGERDGGERGALLVTKSGGGLSFLLGGGGLLRDAFDGLLFLVAGGDGEREQKRGGGPVFAGEGGHHEVQDSRGCGWKNGAKPLSMPYGVIRVHELLVTFPIARKRRQAQRSS